MISNPSASGIADAQRQPSSRQPHTHHDGFRFTAPYYALRTHVLASLFAEFSDHIPDQKDRPLLTKLVSHHISMALIKSEMKIKRSDAEGLTKDLVDDLVGFGPLEDLLQNDEITDIMVVGPRSVFTEINGQLLDADIRFYDDAHLLSICQRIARQIGRRIDESSPMCDARLPDGSRVNIVVPPLAIDGAALTIRKFRRHRLDFKRLIALGALDEVCTDLLTLFVQARCNLVVVGGTGSGKTTFLNCLNQSLHPRERVVTCEDAAELQLQQRNMVRLETRAQNLEGTGEVNMRGLVRNSLRMRPDRIIVGEVRGEEAFDFIQAMNTGHDGSMGTLHANSCLDALSRLEGLISLGAPSLPVHTIQRMITSAVDLIIEVRRFRDGTRKLSDIMEVISHEGGAITTHSLLAYEQNDHVEDGRVSGRYRHARIQSDRIRRKIDHSGLAEALVKLERRILDDVDDV